MKRAGLLLLLTACSPHAEPDDPFPLTAGLAWRYQVATATREGYRSETLRIESRGRQVLDGREVWVRHTSDGSEYYLEADAQGIRRLAQRNVLQAQPEFDQPEIAVLPRPWTVGTRWVAPTRPYLLKRLQPFVEDLGQEMPVRLQFAIEADDDSVDVPAGRFQHCLRAHGEGSVYLLADPKIGPVDVPILQTEWYCRGVGLVKLERREELNSEMVTGGWQRLELQALE